MKNKSDKVNIEKIDKTNTKISYIELLKQIKTNTIDKDNYIFIDNKSQTWIWSNDINGFEHRETNGNFCGDDWITYLTDEYDELDLIDLVFTLVPKTKIEDTPKYIAIQETINLIEDLYMDLEMEIDNCQGCMDGLDIEFERLKIYKDIVKFLGGDIDKHKQELTDKWFEKKKIQEEKEKKEKEKKDKIIKKLPFPVVDLLDINESLRNVLWKQNDKINEICDIIIENKNN